MQRKQSRRGPTILTYIAPYTVFAVIVQPAGEIVMLYAYDVAIPRVSEVLSTLTAHDARPVVVPLPGRMYPKYLQYGIIAIETGEKRKRQL